MTDFFATGRFWIERGVRLVLLMLLFACTKPAFSQCSSKKPNDNMCFYIDGYPKDTTRIRICEGTKIKLIDCSTNGKLIEYSFIGDSTKLAIPEIIGMDTVYTYTYTTPGLYTILQQGNYPEPPPSTTQGLYRYRKCNYIEVLPNVPPAFTLNYCANRQVSVTITDRTYATYRINWGDGSLEQTVTSAGTHTHTYANVNPYTITVFGQHAGTLPLCGGSLQQTIMPVVNLPAPIVRKLTVQSPSAAELQFDAAAGTAYRIEKRNELTGTYTPVASVPPGMARTVSQTLAGDFRTSATYRVVATDVCNSPVVPSEEISAVVLNASTANGENRVLWQAHPVATFVSGELTSNRGLSVTLSAQSGAYTDINVRCGETYCYQVRQNLSGGGVSVSDTFCLKATSTRAPTALKEVKATVTDQKVVLRWRAAEDAQEYIILRVESDGQTRFLIRTSATEYTDADSRLEEQPRCYQVIYTDACGNVSEPSATVCPIRLQGNVLADGYQLVWEPYKGWNQASPTYRIEKLNAQNLLLDVQLATQEEIFFPKDTINQLIRFRITAEGGNQSSVSNVVEIRQPVQLGVPEAFSPNGDGLNDELRVQGLFVQTFLWVVYNRWGEIVYSSTDIRRGWDGRNVETTAPQNVYTYAITVQDQLGKTTIRRGSVLLLR